MSRQGLINDLVACLDERFQSQLSSDTVLQAMLKFDTKLWPESDDDLATYGNEEIPLLLETQSLSLTLKPMNNNMNCT